MLDKLQLGFLTIVEKLSTPIIILNTFGGIFSGIWLAILGEWGMIVRGIIFIVISSFGISIALMPSLLFVGPAAIAMEKGKKFLARLFGLLNLLYTVFLVAVWCLGIMWIFISSARIVSFIPTLIWSYGVALAPWMWLAQKDQQAGGNEYSMLTVFFAQISYIIAMIMLFFGATFGMVIIVFLIMMLICVVLQALTVFGEESNISF